MTPYQFVARRMALKTRKKTVSYTHLAGEVTTSNEEDGIYVYLSEHHLIG